MKNQTKLLIVVIFFSSINILAQNIEYEIIDLGEVNESFAYEASSISDSGQITGAINYQNLGISRAFSWADDSLIIIPDLTNFDNFTLQFMYGHGVNSSGFVVGNGSFKSSIGTRSRGFIYNGSELNVISPADGVSSVAWDLNEAGVVTGLTTTLGVSGSYSPFIFNGSNLIIINTPKVRSYGHRINNKNEVVGFGNDESGTEGFIYTDNNLILLGSLFEGGHSRAYGLNDNSVVVGEAWNQENTISNPFIWIEGFGMKALPGSNKTVAFAINNNGIIVGKSLTEDFNTYAVKWEDDKIINLNTLIDNQDWQLREAKNINNLAQIVGVERRNGLFRAFLLNPISGFSITSPTFGEQWFVDESNLVKWDGPTEFKYIIELTIDGGKNYNIIDTTEVGISEYNWKIPDSLSSSIRCKIRVSSLNEANSIYQSSKISSISKESEIFKIKGYDLTRIIADTLQHFLPTQNGWGFANNEENMWPESWWEQFDYKNIIDINTNKKYPSNLVNEDTPLLFDEDFLDWQLFVELFDISQTYINPFSESIDYRLYAIAKYYATSIEWAGSCFGFSHSSLIAWQYPQHFKERFSFIKKTDRIHELQLNKNNRKLVNLFYGYQFGEFHQVFDSEAEKKNPRTLLFDLKSMFINNSPRALNYRTDSYGHSVVPYKMNRINSSGLFKVYVYDNLFPSNQNEYIIIDSSSNTWQLDTLIKNNDCYLGDSLHNYLSTPNLGYLNKGLSQRENKFWEVYSKNWNKIEITNSMGEKIGFDNSPYNNVNEGHIIQPYTGYKTNPIGYYLPEDNYQILSSNLDNPFITFYAFNDAIIYTYGRSDAKTDEIETLQLSNNLTVANPSNILRIITLSAISSKEDSERSFEASNITMQENDSLNIAFLGDSKISGNQILTTLNKTTNNNFDKREDNSLRLLNKGNSKNYNLMIRLASRKGTEYFGVNEILLEENSTHILIPDWSNLSSNVVKIFIDKGNDGSIDDSIFVVNDSPTGINESPVNEIPKKYKMGQNYPNPFNPTTTISYSIPNASSSTGLSNVQLKVYDILGKEVTTLVNEQHSAGNYKVEFDASSLNSGIYFYTIRSGKFFETKKMLLMK